MNNKEKLIERFESNAFKIGDSDRFLQYLILESVLDYVSYEELVDRLLVIHADKGGY